MNYLDIVLIIPLLWGLYKGITRGIVKELASLLALILGIYGAVHFSDQAQPYLQEHLTIDASLLPVIAFAFTFIAIALLVRLLGLILDKLVKMVALGFVSRLLGAVFGMLKAAFLMSALLLIINPIDKHLEIIPKEQKASAFLYQPVSLLVPSIMPVATDGNTLLEEAEKMWDKAEDTIPL